MVKENTLSDIYEKMFKNLIVTVSNLALNNYVKSANALGRIAHDYFLIKDIEITREKGRR